MPECLSKLQLGTLHAVYVEVVHLEYRWNIINTSAIAAKQLFSGLIYKTERICLVIQYNNISFYLLEVFRVNIQTLEGVSSQICKCLCDLISQPCCPLIPLPLNADVVSQPVNA